MQPLKIDDLFARRSIRKFLPLPVSDEMIRTLLQAAMAAPSAGNHRPWHFCVVRDQQIRERLSLDHPYAKMLPAAPLCIVPCGVPELGSGGLEGFWVQDVAASCESLLLAAHGLGLGAVWCGVYPRADRVAAARAILKVPETVIPFAYVAVGHPAESQPARTQYEEDRVHYDQW